MFFADAIEVQGLGNRSCLAGGERTAVADAEEIAARPAAAARDVVAADDSFDAAAAAGLTIRNP